MRTEEEQNALPGYDEDNWLSKYNYLLLLQMPLSFDQLTGSMEYVEGKNSHVTNNGSIDGATLFDWSTAISNNIMMAGKHYASFETNQETGLMAGVMRPGEAMQNAQGDPLEIYDHFTQRAGSLHVQLI